MAKSTKHDKFKTVQDSTHQDTRISDNSRQSVASLNPYRHCVHVDNGRRQTARMKPTTTILALRPSHSFIASPPVGSLFRSRAYATQTGLGTSASPTARRRKVTAFNDDGFVPWNQLSAGEKASRATQQSFNFGLVIAGIVLTVSLSFSLFKSLPVV